MIYVFYFMGDDMVMDIDGSWLLIVVRITTTSITALISTFITILIITVVIIRLCIVIMLIFDWCLNISFMVYLWM